MYILLHNNVVTQQPPALVMNKVRSVVVCRFFVLFSIHDIVAYKDSGRVIDGIADSTIRRAV